MAKGLKVPGPFVLNAFRHQIWNHPHRIESGQTALFGAQRLSASDMESPSISQRTFFSNGVCSTPFGIRYGITVVLEQHPFHVVVCSTPFGIRYGITAAAAIGKDAGHLVLNAFRHQIWNHGTMPPGPPPVFMCSTPFGIRYGITRSNQQTDPRSYVLNAFRHQIWNHLLPAGVLRGDMPVLNAFRHQIWNHFRRQALHVANSGVLNAFRHQIWNHSMASFSFR